MLFRGRTEWFWSGRTAWILWGRIVTKCKCFWVKSLQCRIVRVGCYSVWTGGGLMIKVQSWDNDKQKGTGIHEILWDLFGAEKTWCLAVCNVYYSIALLIGQPNLDTVTLRPTWSDTVTIRPKNIKILCNATLKVVGLFSHPKTAPFGPECWSKGLLWHSGPWVNSKRTLLFLHCLGVAAQCGPRP
jgi:hypothetical protein